MMLTTHATLAVLTAFAPLAVPQTDEASQLRSYDLSGCELFWDEGLLSQYEFGACRPFEDFEYLGGLERLNNGPTTYGGNGRGRNLKAKDASDLLLDATGAFASRGKRSTNMLIAPPGESTRLLVSADSESLRALDANFEVLQAALAPQRRLIVERWRSPSELRAGLLTEQEFAALTQGMTPDPAHRWQIELSPGATVVHDARRFEPMVLDYDVQIASGSFALDEVSGTATEGARLIARYGGSLGGGWLRVSFELNEFTGSMREEQVNLGGWINAEETSTRQVLPTTFEFQDVTSRGFQLAGFLPEGGAYLVGLGTRNGGEERDWISVRVEGEDLGGVHTLTAADGVGSTLLIEAEGFTQQGFSSLLHQQQGPFREIQGLGLLGGYLNAGTADSLLGVLPVTRAQFRVLGPFIVVTLDGQTDRAFVQQLLETCAAKSVAGPAVHLSGSGRAGDLGSLSMPAVPGVNFRAWSLLCQLHVETFDTEVATNSSAVDPGVGLDVTGLVLEGRPRGAGWELELWGTGALAREPKQASGWGDPTLYQSAVERYSTLVRVPPGTTQELELGGGPAPSMKLSVRER